jgi:SAM-dependent methyltransferase
MPYSRGIAPYYDLFNEPNDPRDDGALFIATLLVTGSSVLDIGAGTGTTAIALAEAGFVVTALEPDPEMHAMLLCRLSGRREIARSVTPILGSAGADTGRTHDLCSCFSVLHLLARNEQAELLAYAKSQLSANGCIVLDAPMQSPRRTPREWSVVSRRSLGRLQLEHLSCTECDSPRWRTHWRFASHLGGQIVHQVDRTFEWQPLSDEDVEELLITSGLQATADYATLTGEPYVPGESTSRVIVARAA